MVAFDKSPVYFLIAVKDSLLIEVLRIRVSHEHDVLSLDSFLKVPPRMNKRSQLFPAHVIIHELKVLANKCA